MSAAANGLGDIVQGLVDRLLAQLLEPLKRAFAPARRLFGLIGRFFTGFKDSFLKGRELTDEIINEIQQWRNFKEDIHVRTGVISLPAAIDKSQQLLDQIVAAWHSIVDLGRQIRNQAQGQQGNPAEEAEQAAADIESSGIRTLFEKFPKLAKGFEKILGFVAVVVGVLETIQSAIDDLKNIVDAIKGIREEIETGSTVFLSQKNPRKTLGLRDGGSIRIRTGNLHKA